MTALTDHLRNEANWRDQKSAEYQDDDRNQQSSRALRSLAEYIECGEAESRAHGIIDALEAHIIGPGARLGGERAHRETSRYGFGYEATALAQHEDFLQDLWVACMEDAYEYAGDHGEDWTGELFDFEVSAAVDGVHLPARYWELRPKQTEVESADAVAAYRAESEVLAG